MKLFLTICCSVFAVASAVLSPAETNNWPAIHAIQEKRTFVQPGKGGADTPFLLFLKDIGGVPIYKLECHNGNYEDSSELNFSGDFQCDLFGIKGGSRTTWNLLAAKTEAKQNSDWLNRGRMTSNQLWGKCSWDPEYGKFRTFKLRGMLITFRFTDLKWSAETKQDQPRLEQFTFEVSVVRDKNTEAAAADVVKDSTPPSSCN